MGETNELAEEQIEDPGPEASEPGPDRRARIRKAILPVVLALVVAGGGLGGWYWWTIGRFIETTDDAYVHSDTAVISPEIEGYVHAVRVVDNQAVKAGDALVVIDDRDFRARVAAAEADLAAKAAAVQSMAGQITLQQSMIDQAAAAVPRAEADLTLARQDHERYQRLARDDFASEQRFESATADLKKAEASLVETQAAFASARNRSAVLQAELTKAEAERRQAEASLELARTDLDRTVIRAPVPGVIGNKGVRVGELVRPGDQLMALVPLPRGLRGRQLQGDPARSDAARPAGRARDRRLAGQPLRGPGRELRAGHRLRVQPAATRERDRQLHQDRPAGAGAHRRPRRQPARRPAAAGPLRGRLGRHPIPGRDGERRGRGDRRRRGRDHGRRSRSSLMARALPSDEPDAPTAPSAPPVGGPAAARPAPTVRDWLGFLIMVGGMFMAILDIQIVSSSLAEIQAGLSASADEISWVQTSYLIAEVVMIPLSGFLARLLSTRVLFVLSASGFTLMSVACAMAGASAR